MSKPIAFHQADGVTLIDIDQLVPFEKNAKRHPPEQLAKLEASFRQFGWRNKPIEITPDNLIVNGHGRWATAKQMGLTQVPVVVLNHMTDDEVRAYRIADNKSAESDWDTVLLQEELFDLNELGIGLDFVDARDLEFATVDLGEMNLGAVSTSIAQDVEQQANRTQDDMTRQEDAEVSLSRVLGFSKVNGYQRRQLTLLLAHAEAETGKTGAEALAEFARDFIGLEGDVSANE